MFSIFSTRKAGRGLVLDNESLDLIVVDVARPDDRDIAPGRVADPLLLAVKDPGIAVAFCGGEKSAGRAGTDEWLGQSRNSRSCQNAPSAAATSASALPTHLYR